MNLLQLCNKVPFPVRDGGTAAMHQLSDQLHRAGHKVKIIAINTHKQHFSEGLLPPDYKKVFSPGYVFIDTRIKPHHAFLNLFSSESYNIKRFDCPALHEKLAQVLQVENFDCVLLDSLFVAPYLPTIRKYSDAQIILRAHNVEHLVWERFAANEKNPLKKRYLSLLSRRLGKFEAETAAQVDGIAAISMDDVNFFRKHLNARVEFIPFGYEIRDEPDFSAFRNRQGYFIGAMNWFPNLEAGRWLVENLLPCMKNELREFQLTLAGVNMPEEFFHQQSENFHIKGKVENAADFVKEFGILVAPIFSGGGLKVKVVEAMANGKLVITTPVGAEGLNVRHEREMLIVETPAEFCIAIKRCVGDKTYASGIARAGFELIRKEYQPKDIISRLVRFIEEGKRTGS